MSKVILAEKPIAGKKMKDVLDIPTVPAKGHLLELKAKARKWAPPYFDLQWVVRKKTVDDYNKIIKHLKEADEIYIGTDYDVEGQLIAYNLLKEAGITLSSVHRMKFSSLEPETLQTAFKNTIPFDENMALSAECIPAHEMLLVGIEGKTYLTTAEEVFNCIADADDTQTPMWIYPKIQLDLVSFNPLTLKSEFSAVKKLFRKRVSCDILKIETKDGRIAYVDENHPFFQPTKHGFKTVRAKQLKIKDYVVIPKKVPLMESAKQHIDLIEESKTLSPSIRKSLVIFDRNRYIFKTLSRQEKTKLYRKFNISYSMFYKWKKTGRIPLKYYITMEKNTAIRKYLKIGIRGSKLKCQNWVNCILPLNSEFGGLLGYYLAEGSSTGNLTLSFNSKETELIKDAEQFLKNVFGIQQVYKTTCGNCTCVIVYGKIYSIILKHVFKIGRNAHEKRIPQFVYSAKKKFRKNLIQCYLLGDGYISNNSKDNLAWVSAKTASLHLTYGFQYLLLSFSTSTIIRDKNKRGGCYEIVIQGGENLRHFLKLMPRIGSKTQYLPKKYQPPLCERYPVHLFSTDQINSNLGWSDRCNLRRHIRLNPTIGLKNSAKVNWSSFVKMFIEGQVHAVEIQSISKEKYNGYLYNFETKNGNFLQGLGIYTHNCRHFLDWYFGMNISKSLTELLKEKQGIRKYYLTPVGRVQTPVLHNLVVKEKEINKFAAKDEWVVWLKGVYDTNKIFSIINFKFDTEEGAKKYANRLDSGFIDHIATMTYETETFPPNKDYVVKECLRQGISTNVVDFLLQDLYQDGLISYPRTDSDQYKIHGVDTQKYLKRLTAVLPLAEKALGKEPREGEKIGVHPALYPIEPYSEKDLKGVVWTIIAEAFVKSHLPPEKHTSTSTYVDINDEIKPAHDNPDMEEGDDFRFVYNISKRKSPPPSRLSPQEIYEWMVKTDIGTVDTRTQTLTKLARTYIFETKAGLYTSSKGIQVCDTLSKIYPDIIDVALTRRFEKMIASVRNGAKVEPILAEGRKTVTEIVKKIREYSE